MIDGRAGGFAVILENENVAEALVILQVQHAVAIAPEHVFHSTFGQAGERGKMVWRLNHHFMRANSVHLVKETFAFAIQFALDAQRGKFVRDNPDAPARRVGASAVPTVNENFRWSSRLVADAKGAILLFSRDDALTEEVVRALPSFRRNDHPAARYRVFTQLRQSTPPRRGSRLPAQNEQPGALNCTASGVPVKMLRSGPSHLRAERILVQPYHGWLPRMVINGRHVKPAGGFADVTLRHKSLGGADDHALFFPGNTQFRQRRQIFPNGARSDFHECQRLAIVADQIDFALDAARSVIPGYEYVSLPAQIPVGVGLTANAGATSFQLFRIT